MDGLHRRDHLDTIPRPTLFVFKKPEVAKSVALLRLQAKTSEVPVNSLSPTPRSYFPRALAPRGRAGSHGGAQLNLSQARGPPKLRARL